MSAFSSSRHIVADARIFRAAVLATTERAPHDAPQDFAGAEPTWVVLGRRGAGGCWLTLGLAGHAGPADGGTMAPPGLRPATTRLAQLFREDSAGAEFLFLRNLPAGEDVEGTFEPCEGYARIVRERGSFRLIAFGRCATRVERRSGVSLLTDIANPPHGVGHAWRIDGRRKPWAGEVSVE